MVVVVMIEFEIASFHIFGKNTNNGLKWVMNTGTHKLGFLTHLAVITDQKTALEMAWGPSSGIFINKKMHCG